MSPMTTTRSPSSLPEIPRNGTGINSNDNGTVDVIIVHEDDRKDDDRHLCCRSQEKEVDQSTEGPSGTECDNSGCSANGSIANEGLPHDEQLFPEGDPREAEDELLCNEHDQHQKQGRRRRRSSVTLRSISSTVQKHLRSYWISTIALCSAMFVMSYILISPFPYAGFMSMHLVEGVTHETAGRYAGILSSSFMLGRAVSAYFWGKAADTYGRRVVLIASLFNSMVLSLAFGMSPTYEWALVTRFLLGFGNGIMVAAKCSVSELARGNRQREARGMALVVAVWGYAMLLCPAISGGLSEPRTTYPDVHWTVRLGGRGRVSLDGWLERFPFVLPNVLGSFLALVSLVLVTMCVEETLPDSKRRDARYMIPDAVAALFRLAGHACHGFGELVGCNRTPLKIEYARLPSVAEDAERRLSTFATVDQTGESSVDVEEPARSADRDVALWKMRSASELAALLATERSRKYYSAALQEHRSPQQLQELQKQVESQDQELSSSPFPQLQGQQHKLMEQIEPQEEKLSSSTTLQPPADLKRPSRTFSTCSSLTVEGGVLDAKKKQTMQSNEWNSGGGGLEKKSTTAENGSYMETRRATISSLMKRTNTRKHLIAYWVFSFVNVSIDEAFPLFCMSRVGGLGIDESRIGWIMSGSGVVFVVCQYFAFAAIMDRWGLHRALTLGILLSGVPVILFPVSLPLNRHRLSAADEGGQVGVVGEGGDITMAAFIYLSALMALVKVFGGVFYAGITIGLNRSVEASHRATMNGLATLGGSTCRAAGPMFTGFLAAYAFSSSSHTILPPRLGSLLIFGVIAVLGLFAVVFTARLEDEEEESSAGKESGGLSNSDERRVQEVPRRGEVFDRNCDAAEGCHGSG